MQHGKIYDNITELIGNTPMVRLHKVPTGGGAEVIVKALSDPVLRHRARYIIYGMNELLHYAADLAEFDVFWWRDQYNGRLRSYPHDVVVVDCSPSESPRGSEPGTLLCSSLHCTWSARA